MAETERRELVHRLLAERKVSCGTAAVPPALAHGILRSATCLSPGSLPTCHSLRCYALTSSAIIFSIDVNRFSDSQSRGSVTSQSPGSSDSKAQRYQRIQKLLGERRAKLELEGGSCTSDACNTHARVVTVVTFMSLWFLPIQCWHSW